MTPYIKRILFLLVLICPWLFQLYGQTKIQVVTKTITKTIHPQAGEILEVNGEKASITLKASHTGQLKITLSLISKNPSRSIAEEDLKFCDYKMTNEKGKTQISNFFVSQKQFKEIGSNLSARYDIEVPPQLAITIKNIYGQVQVTDLEGKLTINSSFGQVSLSNLAGTLVIQSNFSDITGSAIKASTKITAQSATIILSRISNRLNIVSQFGNIALTDITAQTDIFADMTKVDITLSDPQKYTLNLEAQNDKILAPPMFQKQITHKSGTFKLSTLTGNTPINIKTNYSPITIK